MEQQNQHSHLQQQQHYYPQNIPMSSSHNVMQNAFTNPSLPSNFPGLNSNAGNVPNPLLMTTLQHFQGFPRANNPSLLSSQLGNPQLSFGNQLAQEINNLNSISNMGWHTQNTNVNWLEQAKVAGMIPIYGMLPSNCVRSEDLSPVNSQSPVFTARSNSSHKSLIGMPSAAAPTPFLASSPCGFGPSTSSSPSTPTIMHKGAASCSSTKTYLNADGQPNSISSHCSIEMQPDSNSAVSSHGSNSVHMHSNIGSVESAFHSGSYAGSGLPSVENVNMRRVRSENQVFVHNLHGLPITEDNIASTSANNFIISDGRSQQSPCDLVTAHSLTDHESFSQNNMSYYSIGDRQSFGLLNDSVLDSSALDDLAWSNIDFSDIDLFSGTSGVDKDAMHSVFPIDDCLVTRMQSGDLSNSSNMSEFGRAQQRSPQSGVRNLHAVTPVMREKIKLRREKELADADKELDRLLSLVAKKDTKPLMIEKPEVVMKLPPTYPTFDPSSIHLVNSEKPDDKIILSPVQFTPPDSPEPSTPRVSQTVTDSSFFPSQSGTSSAVNTAEVKTEPLVPKLSSPSSSPYVFMPLVEKSTKSTKIPVYKRTTMPFASDIGKDNKATGDGNDAYNFDEDDSKVTPLTCVGKISETQSKEKSVEAEVAQRVAKITSAHSEGRKTVNENQQDLWRHVVPKKRYTSIAERPLVPSTPLLPPASTLERTDIGVVAHKSPELLSLSEIFQTRKQCRSSYGFLRIESLGDDHTAIDVRGDNEQLSFSISGDSKVENGLHRPLPRLLLRIPRKSVETMERGKRKGKKKKRKKKDSGWNDSNKVPKKKKKKHKHKTKKKKSSDTQYESQLIFGDNNDWQENEMAETSKSMAVFSRKRRLMMQWNEMEENACNCSGQSHCEYPSSQSSTSHTCKWRRNSQEFWDDAKVSKRFSRANGRIAKGTFVVCKLDIYRQDCPLWRVDNQNLLQKYPKSEMNDRVVYRSSSNYSGWCEQVADGYLVVEVHFLKHTRNETIVELEVPIVDMFPAISSEISENDPSGCTTVYNTQSRSIDAENFAKDPVRNLMITYVKAMLNHCLHLDFLQSVKQGNDWNYLRALNDIDKINADRKQRLFSRVKWTQRYIDMLHFYSCCCICDSENSGLMCQACRFKNVEKIVQLFSNEGYDYDTLQPCEIRYTGCGSPIPAMEYFVCSSCAKVTATYHKLHHMRYLLLKACEEQMENISLENSSASSDHTVDTCMKNTKWLHSIINEYTNLWRKVETNDV